MSLQSAKQITKRLEIATDGTADFTAAKTLCRTQVKTADYQVTEADSGTIFTSYGDADAINYTLPTNPKAGLQYWFVQPENYEIKVTGAANVLVAYSDKTATSVTFTTNNEQEGTAIWVFADGNAFYAIALTAGTLTVA